MNVYIENPYLAIMAILTAAFGVGRLARGITYDVFPPSVWVRMVWASITNDGPWNKLATCYWCLSPWLMLVAGGWFALGLIVPWIAIAWWIFWGWLAISYLAAIIVARDEPAE